MRSSFPTCIALQALTALPTLGACSELVSLGSDCPAGEGLCLVDEDANVPDPGPRVDAGFGSGTDGALRDAGVIIAVDAAAPSPQIPRFPMLRNVDFDLTSGAPGDVTAVSLPTATAIVPWFTCQPIGFGNNLTTAVRAENSVTLTESETPPNELFSAVDGSDTFVSIRHLVTLVDLPLNQWLTEPLVAGEHYGIVLDVRSADTSALLSLQLRGGSLDDVCLNAGAQEILAETAPIVTPGWRTVCVDFTPAGNHTHLVLSVQSAAVTDARIFLDNLRPLTTEQCEGS